MGRGLGQIPVPPNPLIPTPKQTFRDDPNSFGTLETEKNSRRLRGGSFHPASSPAGVPGATGGVCGGATGDRGGDATGGVGGR